MQVKDIMSKKVVSVFLDTEVKDVASLLVEKRIHGVPVVDKNNKVIGIITETNFFAKVDGDLYLSKFIKTVTKNKLPDVSDLNSQSQITPKTTVETIMTKKCITVEPEMEIEKLFEVFRKKGFHTIPVTDKEKNLLGIVTLADIINMSANAKEPK
ncbi:MAG: CBS domain-containing protein [Parcubacteria group bacterium]|jgi:CBS-domain-containing membrane protein